MHHLHGLRCGAGYDRHRGWPQRHRSAGVFVADELPPPPPPGNGKPWPDCKSASALFVCSVCASLALSALSFAYACASRPCYASRFGPNRCSSASPTPGRQPGTWQPWRHNNKRTLLCSNAYTTPSMAIKEKPTAWHQHSITERTPRGPLGSGSGRVCKRCCTRVLPCQCLL